MKIRTLLHTLFSYCLLGILILLFTIPAIIFLLLPKRWRYDNKLYYWCAHLFYKAALKCSLLPITFTGTENIPSGPVIFVSNHQSSLDIPLVGSLAKGKSHIWLAKKELAESLILRFILTRIAVLIDMSTPLKGMRSLIEALKLIQDNGRHAMVFPEGGRYTDGTVHEFYAGFVILAKKTGRPVVPVKIFNAYKVYPPGSFFVHKHPIKVVVGKPFIMQEGESDAEFKNRVYQWFIEQPEA